LPDANIEILPVEKGFVVTLAALAWIAGAHTHLSCSQVSHIPACPLGALLGPQSQDMKHLVEILG